MSKKNVKIIEIVAESAFFDRFPSPETSALGMNLRVIASYLSTDLFFVNRLSRILYLGTEKHGFFKDTALAPHHFNILIF